MPYLIGRKTKRLVPGSPYFGTRWATEGEKVVAARALESLELERNRIVLVPAPRKNFDGHKIRVQETKNPDWYREFGVPYWRSRRSFQLKRVRVERALRRVCVTGIVRRNGYEVLILKKLMEVSHLWAKSFGS
jgi:hypothetical protein